MKALEINAKQFQAQVQPLLLENQQLKSHLIAQNFFIEERKLQLSKLINDIGPNGEDRSLTKAVGDLKVICDMLESERVDSQQQIDIQSKIIDEIREEANENKRQLNEQIRKFNEEKGKLQNQLTAQMREHKVYVIKQDYQMNLIGMEMEDYRSRVWELNLNIQQLKLLHNKQLKQKDQYFNDEMMMIQMIYENQRANSTKQKEDLSQNIKELNQLKHKILIVEKETSAYFTKKIEILEEEFNQKFSQFQAQNEQLVIQCEQQSKQLEETESKYTQISLETQRLKEQLAMYKQLIFDQNEQLKIKQTKFNDLQVSIDQIEQERNQLKSLLEQQSKIIQKEDHIINQQEIKKFKADFEKKQREQLEQQKQKFLLQIQALKDQLYFKKFQDQPENQQNIQQQNSIRQNSKSINNSNSNLDNPSQANQVIINSNRSFCLEQSLIVNQFNDVECQTDDINLISENIIQEITNRQDENTGIERQFEVMQQLIEQKANNEIKISQLQFDLENQRKMHQIEQNQREKSIRDNYENQISEYRSEKEQQIKILTEGLINAKNLINEQNLSIKQKEESFKELQNHFNELKLKNESLIEAKQQQIQMLDVEKNQIKRQLISEQARLLEYANSIKVQFENQIETLINQNQQYNDIISQEKVY